MSLEITPDTNQIDTSVPKKRRPKVKAETEPVEVNLFTALPEILLVPITVNTIYIIKNLFQNYNFNGTNDRQNAFLKELFKYNRSDDKSAYRLVVDKNAGSLRFQSIGPGHSLEIEEQKLIAAISHNDVKQIKIRNHNDDPTKRAFLNISSVYTLNPAICTFGSSVNIVHFKEPSISNTIKEFTDAIPVQGSYFGMSAYSIFMRIDSRNRPQGYYAINKNFPTNNDCFTATDLANGGTYMIRFRDFDTNFKYVNSINDVLTDTVAFISRTEIKYSKKYLREQIRTRYYMPNVTRTGKKNIVVDSYLPTALYTMNRDDQSFGGNYQLSKADRNEHHYTVSRLAADVLNATPISIDTMCKTVGFTLKQIKNLLTKVRTIQYVPVFVGAGGTNMNTLYWLNELCAYANEFNIFNQLYVYEEENIEMSNMLRFPMSLSTYSIPVSPGSDPAKLQIVRSITSNITPNLYGRKERLTNDNINQFLTTGGREPLNNIFFYGAPDISSRALLSPLGNFIAATHANNGCSFWLNPIQNSDIQVESYGLIQLNTFFMNQFRMAIELLSLLANKQDLTISDTKVFGYSFDGNPINSIDRNLYWYISQNMEMSPEI